MPPKMRSHPVTSRGLPAGGGTVPWVTVIVTTFALFALAKAYIILDLNWRSGGEYWLSLDGHATKTPDNSRDQAFAAHAEGQKGHESLPANVVTTTGTVTPTATATATPAATASAAAAAATASGLLSDSPTLLQGVSADCGAQLHMDLDGPAVSWGLSFKTDTPEACCQACKDHKPTGDQQQCNSFVWCPDAECWSPDIWNHIANECWLKVQADPANPQVNAQGAFAPEFRAIHSTAPERVQWMAGVMKPGAVGAGRRAGRRAGSMRMQ